MEEETAPCGLLLLLMGDPRARETEASLDVTSPRPDARMGFPVRAREKKGVFMKGSIVSKLATLIVVGILVLATALLFLVRSGTQDMLATVSGER